MLPSSAELEYFLEVSNTLNLSRASERLGISQPSLSLAMKRLEESVGTLLLIRHKQGVSLTQAGKQLMLHTRQLLQYWEDTKSQALASQQKVQGHFTLGCNAIISIYLVSRFLPDLLEQYPKLDIQLKHDISRKITEQVIKMSIDIGIAVNPLKHPDLIINKLCDDEFACWTGAGNRSIQNSQSKEVILLCDPSLHQSQILLKKCRETGIVSERIVTTDSLEVIASLTESGCGIGILPTRYVALKYPETLKRIPNSPVYSDEVCLIYKHENRNVQAIQTIIAAIKASEDSRFSC